MTPGTVMAVPLPSQRSSAFHLNQFDKWHENWESAAGELGVAAGGSHGPADLNPWVGFFLV